MPPKKVQEPERKPMIGRVGTNLKLGIVGVPNVGKSTFFNVLTKSSAAAENFPFCTIDPNENKYLTILFSFSSIMFSTTLHLHTHLYVICVFNLSFILQIPKKKHKNSMSTCNIQPNQTDYYIAENVHKNDFELDQTILVRSTDLARIPFLDYQYDDVPDSEPNEAYPYVNSYYPYVEDADPLSKVESLLAEPELLEIIKEKADNRIVKPDVYTEQAAQTNYLESRPVSFIILGKPDIGQRDLGRQIANFWKCVYIEPQTLIEEELESGSRAGECIEFNLRCGRAIGIDIILELVQQKVRSEAAKHRGFVLSGLPVVANDLYEEDPVSSETAIFTARDIFEKVLTLTADICMLPSNPQVSMSSKFQSEAEESSVTDLDLSQDVEQPSISEEFNIGKDYNKQLEFLFNLLEEPYFIVYVQCGTMDVLNKRDGYRFDVFNNKIVDTQRRMYNQTFLDRGNTDLISDDDFDFNLFKSDYFRWKYLVKLPRHFKANVSSQLDYYHYVALNFIQNRILAHLPEYFIKVDGRTSVADMLAIVKAKLNIMNVQKVVVPKKLTEENLHAFFNTEDTLLAEDIDTPRPNEEKEEEKKLTPQECFKELRRRHVPGKSFHWSWSQWGAKCPVSMKMGYIKDGDVKYAVQFMNKIFFLAGEDAYLQFQENPRPYLLPPYPRPTCRIFIFGPRRSGRTALAHCLAYYYGGTVLSAQGIMNEYLHQRQTEYLEKIRQHAIAEGIALLNKQREIEAEEQEKERIEQIKEWIKEVLRLLEEMSNLLTEIEKEEKKETFEISSFPMAMKRVQTTDELEDSELAVALSAYREQLQELNVPIYKMDISVWKPFLTDRRKLFQFLPPNLAQKCQPKPATVFDDFVKEYVESVLANAGMGDVQIGEESVLELFKNYMKEAEDKYRRQGFGRGGWVIDGMLCKLKILQDFFPEHTADEIIVLEDKSEQLIRNYIDRQSTFIPDYKEFFASMGMYDIAWRCPSVASNAEYSTGLIKSILDEILEDDAFEDETGSNADDYKKDILKFQGEWSKVRQLYLNNNITPLEIEIKSNSLQQLFQDTLATIKAQYTYKPTQFTEEDRAEEVSNIQPQSAGGGENDDSPRTENVTEYVRRYGETLCFCPVTLSENFALWKGKEEFAVKYNEKVYLLSSDDDMKKFIKDPCNFLLPDCFNKVPPARICIIGVSGSGKTTLSKLICLNYGMIYLSYQEILKEFYNDESSKTLNELKQASSNKDLHSYLNSKMPFPDKFATYLSQYWREEPYRSYGFVFDDFPRTDNDIDCMIQHKLIPDLILCLQAEETYLKTKFLDRCLKSWQAAVDKQHRENELKHAIALEKWREQRSIRFNELLEERREKRYTKKLESVNEVEAPFEFKSTSLVSFDSVADQQDVDEINKIVDEEVPPIVYDIPTDNQVAYVSKTEPFITGMIQSDMSAIKRIKDKCQQSRLEFLEIPLDLDSLERTKRATFLAVQPVKLRSRSYLESCFDVSLVEAEQLLASGYYFLSKFGKTCPVQYYDNNIPIQLFRLAEAKGNVYPIIHRNYIYFVIGQNQRELFRNDPLKYIKQDFNFPLISHKVGVVGPPKCGKSILSERVHKEFGFKLITRGDAVRYVLKHLFDSNLAKNMELVLRRGWELTDEMIAASVEAATFDPEAIQGVVFDGFPNTLIETRHLAYLDLVPSITIDLTASRNVVLECLAKAQTRYPKYSVAFVMHIYRQWIKEERTFRKWFDEEYQAMTRISISNTSIWNVWKRSKEYFFSTFSEISHYHKHIVEDWPLRLGNMLVTPLEFLERISMYKTYCPVCLHYSNQLINGGNPPDRTGVVQFRKYFYWICQDHIELFLKCPESFLPPYNAHGMPENLPSKTSFKRTPENLYENGACAVCYKTKRVIMQGKLEFGSTFNGKSYLFDSIECLNAFLKSPSTFLVAIEFHAPVYPSLDYKELPVMGMLEQYIAKYVVQGLSFVAKRRPVIPGLTIKQSALIGLGLFIRVKNDKMPNDSWKKYFEEGLRLYNERRDNLLKYLDLMKLYRNPYLHYEEPLPRFALPPASEKSESLTTMVSRIVDQVPVPDERFDYLCEYFKPLSKVPAFLNVVDIAGLVKGASEGQGLGNAFLSHISACDAVFHLCRAFEDEDVIHVEGEVNPVRDLDIISEELRLKDEAMLAKNLETLERTVLRGGDKKQKPEYDALAKVKTILVDEKKHIRFGDWDSKDIEVLNKYLFLTSKPCIYLVNLSEKDYIKKKNKWLIKIKEWVDKNDPGALIIPFSGAFEYKLLTEYEDPALRKKYLEETGVTSALDKIIVQGYKALQLEYFFTAGPDEVKAWTIQKGTKAPQAAGKIHTDFEKGFIMAEVMKFNDFKEEGSEAACKGAGKYRQQGRNYVVEDGDIIFFKFNAGAGLKDAKKK